MSEHRIASRYAKSLLDLSIEKGTLEEVAKDMEQFAQLCVSNRELFLLMRNPIVSHGKKLSILDKIFEGKVNVLTLSFFKLLTKKKRENHLPEIAREFTAEYNAHKGIVESSITTVAAISEDIRTEVKALVKKITSKKEVILVEHVDEALIGGFVLKIADRQIDDSVSSKLRELKLKFSQRNFVSQA
ncbi:MULTISPECIES: ATP synthase F1 subunit delta [Reichenbachiella]|uniref:ATP synthase subunit delta n=1 Tax=Reichenbachiella agariperforans TaxID=156994 RepID=A0A1M6WRT9_REIAG|nr:MULTISPECIES: ATP synthase F1 subunit delta [Reichenbachiella]MBU2914786.1 ATP synthase F1 subunit delta [Reichenbachiella agariperforans]RJE71186.1 ATP synthase F1 subunit delta [Reichenbachiella sp. MSK19-1]SHK96235.1 F-type H+-transporting ATPase subunit delta [Reichenbachiella agariperforans]